VARATGKEIVNAMVWSREAAAQKELANSSYSAASRLKSFLRNPPRWLTPPAEDCAGPPALKKTGFSKKANLSVFQVLPLEMT
jgi:hypothetical protein